MLKRMPSHIRDDTCPACVIARDFIFLAHHAGGATSLDITGQMRATFERTQATLNSIGASLQDLVQINLYLRDLADFDAARAVFTEFFEEDSFPARMTLTTDFLDNGRLCMIDGVAYKPRQDG